MRNLANLCYQLDQTNKTNEKIALAKTFFETAPDDDKCWFLALVFDKRPKRPFSISFLKEWAAEFAQIESWLFEECYHTVGDLAETIALLLPEPDEEIEKSASEWIKLIISLEKMSELERKQAIQYAWSSLSKTSRFLFNKLLTGGLRIGISQQLAVRALAEATQTDINQIVHQLTGNWSPFNVSFQELINTSLKADISKPYPFCLAYPVENQIENLGDAKNWAIEWKWDGIRGQIIFRNRQLFIWSRGEELITEKFPELHLFTPCLPENTVLDGEILCFRNGKPLSFQSLQTRITRKNLTKKMIAEMPAVFMAYDVLEYKGEDIRNMPYSQRRKILENIALRMQSVPSWKLSESYIFENWNQVYDLRSQTRQQGAEGFMIKLLNSPYHQGRKKGGWWKWKLEPYSIDAILLYAQKGHGRRAGLYTDFTFGVWNGDEIVTFAKAYSGLTDEEFEEVNRFIRQNTLEQFGPVRTVKPELVFEIGFEGIAPSTRHKSGVAVRFPRILRWRKDKLPSQADTLETLKNLLNI
ncbi:MAG: ATP-dependent DNA ligase [Cytophagales bacterium]|nr:ATP-dependent DNA ligase [Cytophagales bacterium]MDW8383449.1 ATP-dependent DNA ligase [Flammeovirgaceae bacterium]